MKKYRGTFFQAWFFKKVCCLIIILTCGLSAVYAKDNKTKYEETKQFLKPDLQHIRELNLKILQRAKDDLDAIPIEPIAMRGESSAVRDRREARAKLVRVIGKLDISMREFEKMLEFPSYYIGSTDADPAIASYAARIEERIEKHGTNNAFRVNGSKRYGQVSVSFIILEDGKLDKNIFIKQTSLDGLGEHVIKLIKQLSPFEAFPSDVAVQGNHMIFNKEFSFTKD